MDDDERAKRLVERVAAGEVRALARAISLVENGEGAEIMRAAYALGRRALRVGLTGAPGVGKSTLADALVRALREEGELVALVAVDPTSPLTGGALLGDRIRLHGFGGDAGVYIRSMASRGEAGGVARELAGVIGLVEAAGYKTVFVETIGVGQDEVAVAAVVDATVLVLMPATGDAIQWLKAGVMEMADLFVVNKADMPGASRMVAELEATQSLRMGADGSAADSVEIVQTVASTGEGVGELIQAVRRRVATGVEVG